MAEIIDLTVSPPPEIIEILFDQENTPSTCHDRARENNKRKRKKGKTPNGLTSDTGTGSAQPSRVHSPETRNKHSEVNDSFTSHLRESAPHASSSSAVDEPGLFFFDGTAAPIAVKDSSPTLELTESNGHGLLLPPHVEIFRAGEPIPAELIPPPKSSSDDEEYIEYLDYEDRKAPGVSGLVRYFETEGEASGPSKPTVFKCKNCGAEGEHKTYECPVQICLTCGARDEHSTRSCPISKTCYTCGMKGHINRTCPNRFSAHMAPSDFYGDCDRCGSAEHKTNECPTLWRIYQYVNDEERITIMQSREKKKQLAVGQGGEGYIDREVWCYNCANTSHLGDDCDELPHQMTFPTANSAFSSHNIMSGPFYDPAVEPVPVRRGPRERESNIDWPRPLDDWDADAPVDVGKRGKNKHKERLEKRFREQESEADDWFNDVRNVKKRGMDVKVPPGSRGKTLKFGSFKDGFSDRPGGGPSLLARISDAHGRRNRETSDRERRDTARQSESSIRIRGAATDQTNQDGKYTGSRGTNWERGQERWGRDKAGHGPRGDHGPRYRGGYDK